MKVKKLVDEKTKEYLDKINDPDFNPDDLNPDKEDGSTCPDWPGRKK